jgi:CcmD family protein
MHKTLIALFVTCVATAALFGAAPAMAQEAAAPAAQEAVVPAATPPAAPAAGGEPYRSAMRSQCEDELEKDADWRADVKLRIAPEVHAEDAQQMLTNRRHVIMAYAALWVLVAGFVVFMWLRQRGLQAEIERLEREIVQAAKD